LTNLMLKCAN